MYIDKATIYFSSRKQFCEKTNALPVLPRGLGQIETYFSPKLPDYFIQGWEKTFRTDPLYHRLPSGCRNVRP